MKIFTLIFSFYIFLLASMPCCPADQCNDKYKTEQTSREKSHHDNDDNCKNCSPFSVCAYCMGFANTTKTFSFQVPVLNFKADYSSFVTWFIPTVYLSFWQPPKIS